MDRKVANNIIVGIFVALGFVAFIWVLFSMNNGALFSSNIILSGRFSQVKGLHHGSEVSLSGLRVGIVEDIEVAKDETKELIVKLAISKKFATMIRQDSVATVKTQGVLGDKYIELSIGSESAPVLKDGDPIKTSEQTDLFAKGGNLVEGISKHFENGGDVELLLKNLNKVATNLATLTNEVQREKGLLHEMIHGTSGTNLNKSVAHIESILGKIDKGEGTLGSLINDPTIYEDLKSLMGGAKRSTILKYFMRQFIDSGANAPVPPPNSTPAKK